MAHIVLIVVNVVIALVLGRPGWRAWRATSPDCAAEDAPAMTAPGAGRTTDLPTRADVEKAAARLG